MVERRRQGEQRDKLTFESHPDGTAVITLSLQSPQGGNKHASSPSVTSKLFPPSLTFTRAPHSSCYVRTPLLNQVLHSTPFKWLPTGASGSWRPGVLTDHQVRSRITLNVIQETLYISVSGQTEGTDNRHSQPKPGRLTSPFSSAVCCATVSCTTISHPRNMLTFWLKSKKHTQTEKLCGSNHMQFERKHLEIHIISNLNIDIWHSFLRPHRNMFLAF